MNGSLNCTPSGACKSMVYCLRPSASVTSLTCVTVRGWPPSAKEKEAFEGAPSMKEMFTRHVFPKKGTSPSAAATAKPQNCGVTFSVSSSDFFP